MRRTITIALAALTVTACTPYERLLHTRWTIAHPIEAASSAPTAAQIASPNPVLTPDQHAALEAHVQTLEALGPCDRYDAWSTAAGLPAHFQTVLRRESGCNPNAHNPSGATGLYQVMPMWADDCGTTIAGLYDPLTNILCAAHIYRVQGPSAWSQTW